MQGRKSSAYGDFSVGISSYAKCKRNNSETKQKDETCCFKLPDLKKFCAYFKLVFPSFIKPLRQFSEFDLHLQIISVEKEVLFVNKIFA